jgi:hypothetical protein
MVLDRADYEKTAFEEYIPLKYIAILLLFFFKRCKTELKPPEINLVYLRNDLIAFFMQFDRSDFVIKQLDGDINIFKLFLKRC